MNKIPSFSVFDIISSAINNTSDSNDISSVPLSQNPSPGNSEIAQPNLSEMNSAGSKLSETQTQAQNSTKPEARRKENPANKNIKYEKLEDADETTSVDPRKDNPKPKRKGFMEWLIAKKMESMMKKHMGGDQNSTNGDKGHKSEDPRIEKKQEQSNIDRKPQKGFDGNGIKIKDPGVPSTTFDKKHDGPLYIAPLHNLGPNFNVPKSNSKFPKINLPKFK